MDDQTTSPDDEPITDPGAGESGAMDPVTDTDPADEDPDGNDPGRDNDETD